MSSTSSASHKTEITNDRHAQDQHAQKNGRKTWWAWAGRILTLLFFILVPVLLYSLVKNLDWQEVKEALSTYKITTLLIGGAIALTSYGIFSSYDLLARHYTKHTIPPLQVIPVAFVCYAFNLNLSAWVGSFALRYRLYTRLGLEVGTITKIVSINIITNWLGYIILAGTIFSLRLLKLPESWDIGTTALQLIGCALLGVAGLYLAACGLAKRRSWKMFNHEITLPSFRFAALQAVLAALNWSLMGLLIFFLLPEGPSYPSVLGILLICGIAGVVTHIPAGLGVLEAVFIAMLQHELSKGGILAALFAYRAVYFLLPLAIACVTYLVLEQQAKNLRSHNDHNSDSNHDNHTTNTIQNTETEMAVDAK